MLIRDSKHSKQDPTSRNHVAYKPENSKPTLNFRNNDCGLEGTGTQAMHNLLSDSTPFI